MTNEYATNLAKVKTAMDNRYENKQANKKDNISGDFTNDEVSYPTVRAVKQYIGAQGYLTQHQNLDNYVQKSQTEGLIKNDGTVMTLSSLEAQFDGLEIAITEKATPNTGALKTYQITQGSTLIGEIDTPKDFLVKSGSVKTSGTTLTSTESAAGVGQNEKYISLIINTKDDTSGTGTELIIPATGLVEDTTYDADNATLELNSSTNIFKVKNNGIDTLQLKDSSVTANKIDSTVKDSWLDNEDVDTRINQALSDLADLIYPEDDNTLLSEGVLMCFQKDSNDISMSVYQNNTFLCDTIICYREDNSADEYFVCRLPYGTYRLHKIIDIVDNPYATTNEQEYTEDIEVSNWVESEDSITMIDDKGNTYETYNIPLYSDTWNYIEE